MMAKEFSQKLNLNRILTPIDINKRFCEIPKHDHHRAKDLLKSQRESQQRKIRIEEQMRKILEINIINQLRKIRTLQEFVKIKTDNFE